MTKCCRIVDNDAAQVIAEKVSSDFHLMTSISNVQKMDELPGGNLSMIVE